MTKLCGNCFWFSILPSCIKLQKAGSAACSQWSPDAKVILWQREQEKQDKQTIMAFVSYISAECNRCPAYRKNDKCMIEDCESYLLGHFAGAESRKKVG